MSDDRARLEEELAKVDQAIAAQQGLRHILPKEQLETILAPLREKRASMQAQLSGSGAIAQGPGAVAVGAGGIGVGRDVRQSVLITGDGNVVGNIYMGPPTQDPTEALAIYRRVLVSACRHLPLRGVDIGASDPTSGQKPLELAQVYVDLDTKTQVPITSEEKKKRKEAPLPVDRETRPLGVLEAAANNRRLVILGDPGSGKSTVLNHLALCLAAQSLEPKGNWLARLSCWPNKESDLVPITVVLRDFAQRLPKEAKKAEPQHLWNFVLTRLGAQNLSFAAEPLHAALERGRAIILLDGLDEIPTKAQRTFIRDAVQAFAERYPRRYPPPPGLPGNRRPTTTARQNPYPSGRLPHPQNHRRLRLRLPQIHQ